MSNRQTIAHRPASLTLVLLPALILLLTVFPEAASDHYGQVTFGGLPVPGATVTLSQGDTRVTAVADIQGLYRFAGLADGRWSVAVEMLGFVPTTGELVVPSAEPRVWEISLVPFAEMERVATKPVPLTAGEIPGATDTGTPAAASQQGPTNAPAPALQVKATEAARALVPDDPFGDGGDPQSRMGAADGLLVNGSVNNGAASPFAQPRAFGNNRPGQRSQYNGGAGVLLGNSAWDARPYSFTADRASKPSYADAHVLATFGGPLRIPRLLPNGPIFYVGVQRTHDTNASAASVLMPSSLERQGDFSQSRDRFGRPLQVVDPTTGLPFQDNRIPAERLNRQAQSLLAYYPIPSISDARFNYQAPIVVASRQTNVQSRFNQNLNMKNQLFGTFTYTAGTTDTDSVFGFTDTVRTASTDTAVNWTHRFTQFRALRVRYQFTASSNDVTPYFANRANVSGEAGIGGNNQDPENWGPPALLFASGIAGLGHPQFAANRKRTHAWTAENIWSHGRHQLTFGGTIREHRFIVQSQQDARGAFSFTGSATGSDFADFLLGLPHSSAIAYGNAEKFFRGPSYDAYINDDWRLTPALTMNLGVRWEYEGPLQEREGRLVNLDVAPGFSAAAPVTAVDPRGILTGSVYPRSLLRGDWRGLQPRLGLAWRPVPGSSLVVRGGYGLYRNTGVYQSIALLMAQQPPFSRTATAQTSDTSPLTLADGFAGGAGNELPTFGVDPDFRVGFAQNWQLSAQKDLPASLTVTGTYLGAKGSQLVQEVLPNTYPDGAVSPCPACPAGFVYLTWHGSSLRHAVQGQIRRRLRSGLTATAQYTLAKATDNAGAFTGVALNGVAIAQNWLDLDAEHAPSNFDQRHQLTASFEYTTGVGVTGGGLLTGLKGRLLKGWTFSGQLTAGSGLPLTPIYLTSVSGTGITGTIRASETGVAGDAPPGFYLNPASYSAPPAGSWGTAGRNSARGPAQFNMNAGIARTFAVDNRINLDWRIDATNVLNRVAYASVNTLVGSPQFGLPTHANPMRKLQSSLRMRF